MELNKVHSAHLWHRFIDLLELYYLQNGLNFVG